MLKSLLALSMLTGSPLLHATSDDKLYGGRLYVETIKEQGVTDDGKTVEYPSSDHPLVKTLRINMPPGGETGWHYHPLPGYAYVLSGTMEVIMEDARTNRYETGEAIYEIVKTPHNGRCVSAGSCDIIVFFTSEKGMPITVMIPSVEEKTDTSTSPSP